MTREPRPPPGIMKLNNSVWQFHCPASGRIEMEIIFLHGLQPGDFKDAFWETWRVKGSSNKVWPKEWLAQIFPNARILSVTYDSRAVNSDGQLTMYSLGENLVGDIILNKKYNIGQNCPVFLVGHSWGGIVIKQLVLSAIHRRSIIEGGTMNPGDFERITAFYNNLCGVFYYATPHGGSRLADWASRIPTLPSLFVTLLTTLNAETTTINENFRQVRQIPAYAVAEGLDSSYRCFRARVVEEGSSRQDIDQFYTITGTDHFTVCKAHRPRDSVIMKLVDFICTSLDQKEIHYTRARTREDDF